MRKDRITRAVLGSAIAMSISIAVLAAAPVASTAGAGSVTRSRQPHQVPRTAPALVDAMAADATVPTADEAALMRRARRHREHQAWLARVRAKEQVTSPHALAAGAVAGGSVHDMVVAIFGRIAGPSQVRTALCVADRESHFDPNARNRHSSAAGVFQWIASSWRTYSARYGFAGASVFDANANITVAAHAVADGGWGPWGGGCW